MVILSKRARKYVCVDCIHLAQNRYKWRVLVKAVINSGAEDGEFLEYSSDC